MRYEKKKLSLNLMDFDDLLCGWKRIFQENEKIREYYSLKFRYILVDEYQDTNSPAGRHYRPDLRRDRKPYGCR